MKIFAKKLSSLNSKEQASILTVFVYRSNSTKGNKKATLRSPGLEKEALSQLQDAQEEGSFRGDHCEHTFFRNANLMGYKHLLAIGMGSKSSFHEEDLRRASAAAFKAINSRKYEACDYHYESLFAKFGSSISSATSAVVEGAILADYQFDNYFAKERKNSIHRLKSLGIVGSSKMKLSQVQKGIKDGEIMSECINFTRRVGDTPGNLMTPPQLAKDTQAAAKGTKLKVTVWDKARIKKEKMGGLLGVSLGSDIEPRFIIMEYKGAAASKKPVCFVGKGLTFDSGGISIKPSQSMDEMKYDMQGGAAVIGTMLAIAKLGLKVNAIGLVPSSENMPGPLANKPGDILTARNGKTVEVLNTDAEGRLILMDALSYATEKKPAVIYDAATLTGAILIALAQIYSGVFTRDKKLMAKIQKASDKTGELVWPMPIHDEHVKAMKGVHADLANLSNLGRGGGSSTAAAFLEQFVGEGIPWAHFDIAGTAWDTAKHINYNPRKGASGAIVRTFVELAKMG